jgi:addiction module HigA family antidote
MSAAKLTQERLSELLGVSRRTINEIVTERRGVSADMAHRLGCLFGNTPQFWLNLQQAVDLWKAEAQRVGEYRKIKPLKGAA